MNDQEIKAQARQVFGKCMFPSFATVDENGCPQMRAMMAAGIDEDFTVYYITSRLSAKCAQIAANPKVSSLWTDVVEPMRDWRSVLLKGRALISDDKALRDRFWMDQLTFAFPGGADDPNYVILIIRPAEMISSDNKSFVSQIVKF